LILCNSFYQPLFVIVSQLKKREDQMERQVIQLSADLDERRAQFVKEREAFEMIRKDMEQLRTASIDSAGKE
jgi:uncharacterized protein involved in exopolysaccharide biosynthesis